MPIATAGRLPFPFVSVAALSAKSSCAVRAQQAAMRAAMGTAQSAYIPRIFNPRIIISDASAGAPSGRLGEIKASMARSHETALVSHVSAAARHVNSAGQTYGMWREGLNARIGMAEASGIAIKPREWDQWQAEEDEWRAIHGR